MKASNGQITATEASAIPEIAATNEEPPVSPDVTPQEAMKQVGDLLTSLGYSGLGVIIATPKFGTPINPYEFVPEGWEIRIVPVRANSGNRV